MIPKDFTRFLIVLITRITITVLCLSLCTPAVHAKTRVILPGLAVPHMIDIMGDELYIIDDTTVNVFSLKDHKKLRSFGKKGQGPGELMTHNELPTVLTLHNGEIFIKSMNKVSRFHTSGKLIEESPLRFISLSAVPVGNRAAIYKIVNGTDGFQYFKIMLYDTKTKEHWDLLKAKREHPMLIKKFNLPQTCFILRSDGDTLYVFNMYKGFHIEKFTAKGKALPPIHLDEPVISIDSGYKKKAHEWLKHQRLYKSAPEPIRQMIVIPDDFPPVRSFVIDNDKIYAFTYKTKNNRNEVIVMDTGGKILKRTFIAAFEPYSYQMLTEKRFTVKDDKFYSLQENADEEEWELVISDI